jgi:iron-sulfur cluster assembly accessory protein
MSDVMTHGVKLTETAVGKVKALLEAEGRDDLRLRVAVQPGGCSGLIYQLFFDELLEEEDAVVDFSGVEARVRRLVGRRLHLRMDASALPSRE